MNPVYEQECVHPLSLRTTGLSTVLTTFSYLVVPRSSSSRSRRRLHGWRLVLRRKLSSPVFWSSALTTPHRWRPVFLLGTTLAQVGDNLILNFREKNIRNCPQASMKARLLASQEEEEGRRLSSLWGFPALVSGSLSWRLETRKAYRSSKLCSSNLYFVHFRLLQTRYGILTFHFSNGVVFCCRTSKKTSQIFIYNIL